MLSNTNALEVQGMQDISVQSIVDERLRGHVLGIPGPVVDQLRAVEAFKVSQGWPLFRKPAVLVRKETIDYGRMVEEITLETNKNSIRRVMVGERGSGKTLMLLQAMTMAFLKGWVVINIPEGTRISSSIRGNGKLTMDLNIAQDLILGHTEYGPLPSTNPTLYTQRMYTANLLSAISRANPILKTLQFNQTTTNKSNTNIQVPIPQNISLAELAQLGASNPETAWPIFEVLLADLKAPNRPPLMLCMDGLAHAMHKTHYIDGKEYKPIHAHQFILIKSFLDHLSGASPLPNGGMVLAATSESNNPSIPSLKLALAQLEGSQEVKKDPFKKYDERVLGVFDKGGVQVQRMGGITRQEARGLMEYWARSGVLKQRIDEDLVAEKWVIAGGGVIGELERGCVRMKV